MNLNIQISYFTDFFYTRHYTFKKCIHYFQINVSIDINYNLLSVESKDYHKSNSNPEHFEYQCDKCEGYNNSRILNGNCSTFY